MENENKDLPREIKWLIPEYEKHERSKNWYIGAALVAIFLLVFAVLTSSYLFAIIILITSVILVIHDGKDPDLVEVILMGDGLQLGSKIYDFSEFKNFSVMYKPKEDLKNLYFEFENPVKQRISIPLEDQNPLQIRDFLLKYLKEDLSRTNRPLSESLSKMFKI